ncbi:MAG: iron-sulfur cluster assembly accessory protein [Ignavibacterium sp.]|jgi:iron-sulfur cluster assembly protein|nr:iron-sulfur cluster assembly accessory protein [Ignavibacterium sp.]
MNTDKTEAEITVTEKAVNEIKKIMEENKITPEFGLRIGVKGGGAAGLTYSLGFDPDTRDGDTIIEQNGLKLLIDGKSLFYLSGIQLDYSDGLNGKGFVFKNPNDTKSCGCEG